MLTIFFWLVPGVWNIGLSSAGFMRGRRSVVGVFRVLGKWYVGKSCREGGNESGVDEKGRDEGA